MRNNRVHRTNHKGPDGSKDSVFKGVDLGKAHNHEIHWRHRHNPAGTKLARKCFDHKHGKGEYDAMIARIR